MISAPTAAVTWNGFDFQRTGVSRSGTIYCNLKNLRTQFNANAGTIADISDNALHVVVIANNTATTATSQVTFEYSSRLYFTSRYILQN